MGAASGRHKGPLEARLRVAALRVGFRFARSDLDTISDSGDCIDSTLYHWKVALGTVVTPFMDCVPRNVPQNHGLIVANCTIHHCIMKGHLPVAINHSFQLIRNDPIK